MHTFYGHFPASRSLTSGWDRRVLDVWARNRRGKPRFEALKQEKHSQDVWAGSPWVVHNHQGSSGSVKTVKKSPIQ